MSAKVDKLVPRYKRDQEAVDRLAEELQHLPDNWVQCRDMRHAWDVVEDFHVTISKGSRIQEIKRVLVCARCETFRHETYNLTRSGLEKVRQHYEYPEHYQIKGVPRGVKPQALVQAEQYRRVMEKVADHARTGA